MLKPLVIWGAKGHAKVLHEFIAKLGFTLIALFDNDKRINTPFPGVPLYHGLEGFQSWRSEHPQLAVAGLVAIGGQRGHDRLALQQCLLEHGVELATVVHPVAYVASTARLGAGCQVLAHATVGANASLGEACIINTSASLDHECKVGHGAHLAPGARLAGEVEVGEHTLIAVGAIVLPRVKIGANCIIGAGAIVTRDVPDNTVAYGQPAHFVRTNVQAPRPRLFL